MNRYMRMAIEISNMCNSTCCKSCPFYLKDNHCMLCEGEPFSWRLPDYTKTDFKPVTLRYPINPENLRDNTGLEALE